MPLNRVPRNKALTKAEFHQQLRQWFQKTSERIVGSDRVDGRTSWTHVRDGADLFALHADTSREAVEWYLQTIATHGDELQWEVAPSQRGKMTAVVYGPQQLRNTSFYLYVAGSAA